MLKHTSSETSVNIQLMEDSLYNRDYVMPLHLLFKSKYRKTVNVNPLNVKWLTAITSEIESVQN